MDHSQKNEENLFSMLLYRFLPFWPLFAVLLIVCLAGAWGYLRYATPIYKTTATLIIKDENKGVDDPSMTESINVFNSKKIVENEIEVIHSRTLMNEVVKDLHLYAPIFEKGSFKSISAYSSSPIIVKLKDPESLPMHFEESPEIYFTYDTLQNEVIIDNKQYALDQWYKTSYGVVQFSLNSHISNPSKNPLYFSLAHPKVEANGLLSSLEVSAANKLSTVVALSFKDPVPQRGEDIVNKLLQAYNQAAIIDRNLLAKNTLTFIEERIQYLEEDLDRVEKEVQEYKSTKGIVDLSEQGKLFLNNVGNNDRKIADINIQLAVLDKVEAYVTSKDNHAGIVPSTLGISDPVLAQLLQKLYDSEIEYEKLKRTTAENNPILASITNEIEKIRPGILENIQNQRTNLIVSREKLASTNETYNSALQTIPQKERRLLEISRQQAIKNNVYNYLLQKREETALSYAPTLGDSRIVDLAQSSIFPVSPKRLIIYAIAIVVAFASGLAYVLGKELFSLKVLFRTEVENYTSFPIVGELHKINTPKNALLLNDPKDHFMREQFHQLGVAMGLYSRALDKKKIMVTSSISGEGKSFISTHLALNLTLSGKRTILLDLDFRNPNTSKTFHLKEQKGMVEYLMGGLEPYEIIKTTEFDRLFMVPVGKTVAASTTQLLLNGRLENLLNYLEKEFDYIVIDTPPVELVSDTYLLSEYCDTTLFVIRHNYSPKSVVQRLDKNKKISLLKNLSIVFNAVKPRGFVRGKYELGYGYELYNKKA